MGESFMKPFSIFFTILFVLSLKSGLQAKESSEVLQDSSHDPHAIHQTHHSHHNHLALFAGATTNFEHESTDFSLGVDYEYRLSEMFGIGLFGEIVYAEHEETLIGVPFFFHIKDSPIKIVLAPGVAIAEDHHGDKHEEFLFRGGLGYDIHLDTFSITPTVNADVVDGDVSLVYGIALGVGF
jgi:hypothetical protein